MENPVHLPAGHRFTIYRDEEGNYILESQQEKGLVLNGSTPDEVAEMMAKTVPEFEGFKVWAKLDKEPIPQESIMPTFADFQEMCSDPRDMWHLSDLYFRLTQMYLAKALKALEIEFLRYKGEYDAAEILQEILQNQQRTQNAGK